MHLFLLMLFRWPSARERHPGRAILDQWRAKFNPDWSIELDDEASSTHFVECNADSLDVVASYGGRDAKHIIDHLYANLVSCTDVLSLNLKIFQGGCVVDDGNPWSFNFRKSDTFPHLESLTLSGYDWDSRKTTWWWAQVPSNLESWRLAMDWTRLKRLDIDLPPNSFLEAFSKPNQLAGLESLVLRPRLDVWGDENTLCGSDEDIEQLRQNYTSFITNLPPLRELSIGGMGRSLDLGPILKAHGGSLKNLSLHEYESDCVHDTQNETRTRPPMNVTQLQYISKAAPHLQTMTVDLHRSGAEWPAATIKALSTFENLRDLTRYFDLEDYSKMRPVEMCAINRSHGRCTVPELMQPVLNQETAQRIFRQIRSVQPGKKLQHVTLYAGDYGREEGGGLRIVAHREHNRPVKFDCRVEKDVEVCEGWFGRTVDDFPFDPSDEDGYPKRITKALEPGEPAERSYRAEFKGNQVFPGSM